MPCSAQPCPAQSFTTLPFSLPLSLSLSLPLSKERERVTERESKGRARGVGSGWHCLAFACLLACLLACLPVPLSWRSNQREPIGWGGGEVGRTSRPTFPPCPAPCACPEPLSCCLEGKEDKEREREIHRAREGLGGTGRRMALSCSRLSACLPACLHNSSCLALQAEKGKDESASLHPCPPPPCPLPLPL